MKIVKSTGLLSSTIIALAIGSVAAISASKTSAQALYDCSLLVGVWTGEHTSEDGNYESWKALYAEDQTLYIEFHDRQGNLTSAQTGEWQCDGLYETDQFPTQEQVIEFKYRIQRLDDNQYVYQSLHDGTVFTSIRVTGEE
jgi:hypothetical protein